MTGSSASCLVDHRFETLDGEPLRIRDIEGEAVVVIFLRYVG